jgi:hypothetical protein
VFLYIECKLTSSYYILKNILCRYASNINSHHTIKTPAEGPEFKDLFWQTMSFILIVIYLNVVFYMITVPSDASLQQILHPLYTNVLDEPHIVTILDKQGIQSTK